MKANERNEISFTRHENCLSLTSAPAAISCLRSGLLSTMSEVIPSSANLAFVEALYADYVRDPNSVPDHWRDYFQKLGDGEPKPAVVTPHFQERSIFNPTPTTQSMDARE